ncbi:hypothetical protein [Christiangramia salexigens]|uniref:Uncharacterized protein n=1 Tax=Christiangramia salexigens TaxID=1913577 RepID=A0A1L3J418_9FLAO|nr:hypothetical protein [Christiangramia salexigens]APG59850.1 hypothetical protein LPB144_05215 [Christiangramia salexigens]
MILKNLIKPALVAISFSLLLMNFGCSSDDDSTESVELTVNGTVLFDDGDDFNGDVDGDFTGNGGSGERTFLWQNSLNTADYNADITSSSNGLFKMEVKDADGNVVLNKTLRGGVEPDSFSGVTARGTSGIWSVTIYLSNFNGDGSFSLSEGD